MFTRHYDVIIAGLRPGALLAGNILAKRGLRVLAVDQEPAPIYTIDKHHFPCHDHLLTGFDDPLLLASALDELTIHPGERRLVKAADPSYQVLLPHQRVDVRPNSESYQRSLEREFGPLSDACITALEGLREEAGNMAMAWQDRRSHSPSPSLLQRVGHRFGKDRSLFDSNGPTLADYLDEFDLPADFRSFLTAQVAALAMQPDPEALPLPIAAHILLSARAGIYGHDSNPHPLTQLLLGRFKALRGELAEGSRLTAVDASWGKITQVEFDDGAQVCDCDFLIWGGSYDGLLEVLPESIHSRYTSSSNRLPPDYRRFSVHLLLDNAVIPEAMADHVISVLNADQEYTNGNLILASTRKSHDDMTTVTLSTIVSSGFSMDEQSTLARSMVEHFASFVPYLDAYLQKIYIPPEGTQAQNASYSWSASLVAQPFKGDLGPGPRLPHWNLFHCGRGTYPLLRLEGEFAAGILTVDAISAAIK